MFGNKANAAKWDFQLQEQTLQDRVKWLLLMLTLLQNKSKLSCKRCTQFNYKHCKSFYQTILVVE